MNSTRMMTKALMAALLCMASACTLGTRAGFSASGPAAVPVSGLPAGGASQGEPAEPPAVGRQPGTSLQTALPLEPGQEVTGTIRLGEQEYYYNLGELPQDHVLDFQFSYTQLVGETCRVSVKVLGAHGNELGDQSWYNGGKTHSYKFPTPRAEQFFAKVSTWQCGDDTIKFRLVAN